MTLTIDLTPTEEARLAAAARQEGLAQDEIVKNLVTQHLPLPGGAVGTHQSEAGAENAAAIALLRGWLRAEATEDLEESRKAQDELDELKRNLNANRGDGRETAVS